MWALTKTNRLEISTNQFPIWEEQAPGNFTDYAVELGCRSRELEQLVGAHSYGYPWELDWCAAGFVGPARLGGALVTAEASVEEGQQLDEGGLQLLFFSRYSDPGSPISPPFPPVSRKRAGEKWPVVQAGFRSGLRSLSSV